MSITRVAAPLRQQVITELRKVITTGQYKPGQRLVEKDLCERLGVSRTVVREALRHLEAENLVSLVANHGPVVAELTRADAISLFEVREALEGLAGGLCAQRSTPALHRRLLSAIGDIEASFNTGDMMDAIDAKDAFYEVLFEGAENPVIASLLRPLQARIQLLRALSLGVPGRQQKTIHELRRVVRSIQASDEQASSEGLRVHVRNACINAIAQLDRLEAASQVALA